MQAVVVVVVTHRLLAAMVEMVAAVVVAADLVLAELVDHRGAEMVLPVEMQVQAEQIPEAVVAVADTAAHIKAVVMVVQVSLSYNMLISKDR